MSRNQLLIGMQGQIAFRMLDLTDRFGAQYRMSITPSDISLIQEQKSKWIIDHLKQFLTVSDIHLLSRLKTAATEPSLQRVVRL